MGEQDVRVVIPDDVLVQEGKPCVLSSRPIRDRAITVTSPGRRPRSLESEFDKVGPSRISIQLVAAKSFDEAMDALHLPLKLDRLQIASTRSRTTQ